MRGRADNIGRTSFLCYYHMMIEVMLNNVKMNFMTRPALFSPNGPDAGTLAMLSFAEFKPDDKVHDLGCGWGLVGIYAAKIIGGENVTMSDTDAGAVAAAAENAEFNGVPGIKIIHSDGYDNIDDAGYTIILSNPPYHADFSIAKRFIEKGFNRLAMGGRLVMVVKRLDWYKNKLAAIFGGVTVREKGGYYVLIAEKRNNKWANRH